MPTDFTSTSHLILKITSSAKGSKNFFLSHSHSHHTIVMMISDSDSSVSADCVTVSSIQQNSPMWRAKIDNEENMASNPGSLLPDRTVEKPFICFELRFVHPYLIWINKSLSPHMYKDSSS